jgi:tetratricopeptide (TPR) repeat protein
MGKKNKIRPKTVNKPRSFTSPPKLNKDKKKIPIQWIFLVAAITALCISPMLRNGFTNWDDWDYVINNSKLQQPDWNAILTEPFVGNYHPLTMLSLAINYQISQLDASSYLLFNFLLHLINTALVFYFIWMISDKKVGVAFLTALIFGIHPMHVESVAWISERKDVLYTLFFLLSLLQYWKYLRTGKRLNYWLCFLLFILSLLSKPAAIIFPLVLLLVDYWKGRAITKKVVAEKIPFLLLSLLFAIITLTIQSHSAVVKLESYPLWTRPLFGCYVLMNYLYRFFVPYPLSAFHPYPITSLMGPEFYLAPLFVLVLLLFIWYKRKNKILVFGFLFFIINLLLVLQFISIGSSLVPERYTYVPYIGLAFMLGMLLTRLKISISKPLFLGISAIISVIFGVMSFQRTKVWKNSNTLWTNVIEQYPNAPIPRTNRANDNIMRATNPANKDSADALYKQALEDCNVALKNKPDDIAGFENRQNIYLNLFRDQEAMVDANALIKLAPGNKSGYFTRAVLYMRANQPDKALTDFDKSLSINPNVDFTWGYRGILLMSYLKKYKEAVADFSKAIALNPQQGYYYSNRSYCYFYLGDKANARADALIAIQKGMSFPDDYRKSLNF